MNKKLVSLALLAGFALSSYATVTLQFSVAPNYADGFRDMGGAIANNMPYALVVDASGVGDFSAITSNSIDPFNINAGTNTFVSLTRNGGTATTLKYVYVNAAGTPKLTQAAGGFNGSVTNYAGLNHEAQGGGSPIGTGDQWGIIWFPTLGAGNWNAVAGTPLGFLTSATAPAFTIPANGATVNFSSNAVFTGAGNFLPSYSIVPEPSTYAAIFGAAALAIAIIRRRK
jgi:hypothetical protein